jgi:hypothetical protein
MRSPRSTTNRRSISTCTLRPAPCPNRRSRRTPCR